MKRIIQNADRHISIGSILKNEFTYMCYLYSFI